MIEALPSNQPSGDSDDTYRGTTHDPDYHPVTSTSQRKQTASGYRSRDDSDALVKAMDESNMVMTVLSDTRRSRQEKGDANRGGRSCRGRNEPKQGEGMVETYETCGWLVNNFRSVSARTVMCRCSGSPPVGTCVQWRRGRCDRVRCSQGMVTPREHWRVKRFVVHPLI